MSVMLLLPDRKELMACDHGNLDTIIAVHALFPHTICYSAHSRELRAFLLQPLLPPKLCLFSVMSVTQGFHFFYTDNN